MDIGLRKKDISEWLARLVLLVVGLVYIFPLFWMIATSVKTVSETAAFPPALLPERFMLENYANVWKTGPFERYFMNSLFVSLGIVVMELLIAVPAAYSFAKYKFRGSKVIYGLILSGLMIPMQVVVVPVYLLFSKAGLINTYAALILPFFSAAAAIFLLTESFRQIPDEIIESAKLDRAPEWRVVCSVVLPMAMPALVTIALLVFITHWNDLFWVLIMTNSEKLQTLTAGILKLKDAEGLQWNTLMAGNVILIAPVMLLYLAAGKKIKSAFTFGGVK